MGYRIVLLMHIHTHKHSHSDGSAKMCAIKMSFHNWTFLHSTHMDRRRRKPNLTESKKCVGSSARSSFLPSNASTLRFERKKIAVQKHILTNKILLWKWMREKKRQIQTARMKTNEQKCT